MKDTPPKSSKPNFGSWRPAPEEQAKKADAEDRADYAGIAPEDAAARVAESMREKKPSLRDVTLRQKEMVIRRILRNLAERDLDLGNVAREDMADYREYLAHMADTGELSRDYCSHLVRAWNSTVRLVFGEQGKPGQGLIMRGFKQKPRKVEHVTEGEWRRMMGAISEVRFRTPHYEAAFRTYLEVAWATGARVGSLLNGNLRVADVDWVDGTAKLRHMKNVDEHTVVLTPRAIRALREWVDYLRSTPGWRGKETAVFVDRKGENLTAQWVNRGLKAAATRARVPKDVTTHVLRKSVGTLIARENPKLAQLQLGISAEVFNRHYNQPLLEDRLAKRDILPGGNLEPAPELPDRENIGGIEFA